MINIIADTQEFLFLAKQVAGPFSPLSPLALAEEKVDKTLRRKPSADLVNADGTLRSELVPVFQTLVQTTAFTACTYLNTGLVLDTSVYYPPSSTQSPAVSLSNTDDGLNIQSLPDLGGLMEILAQYLGESLVSEFEMDVDLPLSEAAVLLAVVDVYRRQLLKGLASGVAGLEERVPAEDVTAAFGSEFDDLQWFAPYFLESVGLEAPTGDEVQNVLQKLAQNGFLTLTDSQVVPSQQLETLSSAFMLIDGHLLLRSITLVEQTDGHNLTEVRMLRGRANAVLMITDDGTTANLTSICPAQALLITNDILENPIGTNGAVEGATILSARSESTSQTLSCPHCQAVVHVDKKFCTACGNKIS